MGGQQWALSCTFKLVAKKKREKNEHRSSPKTKTQRQFIQHHLTTQRSRTLFSSPGGAPLPWWSFQAAMGGHHHRSEERPPTLRIGAPVELDKIPQLLWRPKSVSQRASLALDRWGCSGGRGRDSGGGDGGGGGSGGYKRRGGGQLRRWHCQRKRRRTAAAAAAATMTAAVSATARRCSSRSNSIRRTCCTCTTGAAAAHKKQAAATAPQALTPVGRGGGPTDLGRRAGRCSQLCDQLVRSWPTCHLAVRDGVIFAAPSRCGVLRATGKRLPAMGRTLLAFQPLLSFHHVLAPPPSRSTSPFPTCRSSPLLLARARSR